MSNVLELTKAEVDWFVQSNIYRALVSLAEQRRITILDNLSNKHDTPDIPEVRFFQGELSTLGFWVELPRYLSEMLTTQENEDGKGI